MNRERNELGQFIKGHSKVGGFTKQSKHTESSKKLISESLCGKFGEKSRRWKGDKASYYAKHLWIKKHYGTPDHCEQIGCQYPKKIDAGRKLVNSPKRYEWHNISKQYRRERSDWVMLCPSCHRKIEMGKERLCLQ